MNIKHLEYFCTLAKTRHFAKAAQICHVTQPTLSAGIAKLEQELDAELVVRGRQFIALTEQGQLVLQYAENILLEQQNIKQEISLLQSGLTGHLKLGIVPQSNVDIMPIIAKFNQSFPDVAVQLSVMTNQQIVSALLGHQIDIGLGFYDAEMARLEAQFNIIHQGSNQLAVLLAANKTEQFSNFKQLALADVAQLKLCLLNKSMQFRQNIDGLFNNAELEMQLGFETDSLFHLINAVKHKLGSAIVTLETAKMAEKLFGISYLKLHGSQTPETVFLSRKHHLTVVAKAFINSI
ncbi:LysR family transcriptional regulator [Catenovulum agarivorans]|uniref:LysR substrate-binding domain-containing protein n=1 Tax=Catenovulum agarivorans TaxID=1172192 RepID=UPI00031B0CC0|nr:LysR family transcriptional regulator [Catenovulum agarivorans]